MAALNLHNALFTTEKDSDLPLHSATPFLHPAPERDASPTSHLFASPVYQDLIQRQPTHPDGPTSGWDLGLSLLGDPMTSDEHKDMLDHETKTKLRRLHATNVVLELLFGIWGMYTTVRYFLAFSGGLGDAEHVCALVLGVVSAIAVALVTMSILMPLLPHRNHSHAWRYMRSLLRACYLLLVSAGAMMNVVLVLMWHPDQLCHWDLDISWYTSAANTATAPCHGASFAAWITAAILRLVVTSALAFVFIYTLRSFHGVRHHTSERSSFKYHPYFSSDPEYISPVSSSSPFGLSKSTFKFMRSEDSNHTLNQSHVTLPKSNSISTLAPSTSCTGHSRSYSTPPPKDVSPPRISPPTSRRTSTSTHATNHGSSSSQLTSETPPQTQPVSVVATPSSVPQMLRRTNRISVAQVTSSDAMSPDVSSSSRLSGLANAHDPSEIRSWKPGHRGGGAHLDVRKTYLAWENAHVRHAAQASGVGSDSLAPAYDDGESAKGKGKSDDAVVYSYGYGALGPTYPYLDMYNPPSPRGCDDPSWSSCEDVDDELGFTQGYRHDVPSGPAYLNNASSFELRSSPSGEEQEQEQEESSGEEEEYVAMMGGFVRRMATIESLGSREAAGTLSTLTTTNTTTTPSGSVAHHSMRCKTPASQFSSVRFAESWSRASASSSGGGGRVLAGSTEGSLSTAYLSFSSGGTGVRVNERGELFFSSGGGNDCGKSSRSHSRSSYDRQYYTASASSRPPKMDDEREETNDDGIHLMA